MKSYSQKINEHRIKHFHDPDTYRVCSIPRIELSEKADVFTLLHEIGHYFIYKRDQEQTESAADAYCEEFFDNYLPEFFKWIFQIELQVYTKKSRQDFTTFECLKYYKQYKEWIENNSECADV
jgi:hypothetical protein